MSIYYSNIMADETSNAVIESDITQTVSDGINSLDPKEGVMEYILFIYLFHLFIYLFIYLSIYL